MDRHSSRHIYLEVPIIKVLQQNVLSVEATPEPEPGIVSDRGQVRYHAFQFMCLSQVGQQVIGLRKEGMESLERIRIEYGSNPALSYSLGATSKPNL